MNGDYLDYLAHYRTPGSKNGISTTPGYDAIGKRAMTDEERLRARALYRVNKYHDSKDRKLNARRKRLQDSLAAMEKDKRYESGKYLNKKNATKKDIEKYNARIAENKSLGKYANEKYKRMDYNALRADRVKNVAAHLALAPHRLITAGPEYNYTMTKYEYDTDRKAKSYLQKKRGR